MTFISKLKSLFGMGDETGNTTVNRQPENRNHSSTNGSKASYQGNIKYLNYAKGYGFIDTHDFEKNVFVHFSDCIDRIKKGDTVSFDVVHEERGPRAKDVKVVS